MFSSVMKSVAFATMLFFCSGVNGQTGLDCVNYDSRYPITTSSGKQYLWNPLWNFENISQRLVSGIDIGGNGFFKGLFERLPAGYDAANTSKKYPVIIFFHGFASRGNGAYPEICRLFKDRGGDSATHLSIPGRVERQPENFTQTFAGETSEFIVISPQFNQYTRLLPGTPDHFPSGDEVEDVIDYVEATYNVDPRRIYLTGLSNGANMITEYAGSSVARAKRVAAIMPVSLCSQLGHENNNAMGVFAKNIGLAKLKTWFVFCESDNCGTGPALSVPNNWVDSIMKVPGAAVPRYTRLRNVNPATLYNCSDTLYHDAWSRAFDPNFKASYTYTASGAVGANDGINQNMYQWFSSQLNTVLPVKLKEFHARVKGGAVELEWITTDEKDNAEFTIERAGTLQTDFKRIGSLPGLKDHVGEKRYSYVDDSPLANVSYYRLVQTDIDGQKTYFDVRKIINQVGGPSVFVSPNPFVGEVSAYVKLDKAQKVVLTLTDMTGRVIRTFSGVYAAGSTEIKLGTLDLPKGVYVLKVTGENISSLSRIVKR